jgi:peroxiredoxin
MHYHLFLFLLFALDITHTTIAQPTTQRSVTFNENSAFYERGSGKRLDGKSVIEKLKPGAKGALIPRINEYGEVVAFIYDSSKFRTHLEDLDTLYMPKVGEPFAPFFAKTVTGDSVSLMKAAGKIIVLVFMLPLRKPFYSEPDFLQFKKIIEDPAQRLNLYPIIMTQSDEAETVDWMRRLQVNFPVVANTENFATRYVIGQFPSYLVIDKAQRLVAWVTGSDLGELKEVLPRLAK